MFKTARPMYDTVGVGQLSVPLFGTLEQVKEFVGSNDKYSAERIWQLLQEGQVQDRVIVSIFR